MQGPITGIAAVILCFSTVPLAWGQSDAPYQTHRSTTAELATWESARTEDTVQGYGKYIAAYPAGVFAGYAWSRIQQIEEHPVQAEARPPRDLRADGPARVTEASGTSTAAISAAPLPPSTDAGRDEVRAPSLPAGDEIQRYDAAFAALRAADYERAAPMLATFAQSYPQDPLAANARYWLGEIAFARADYVAAIDAFTDAVRMQPSGPKTELALYKIAQSLAAQGRTSEACKAYLRLVSEHPTAPARLLGGEPAAQRRRVGC